MRSLRSAFCLENRHFPPQHSELQRRWRPAVCRHNSCPPCCFGRASAGRLLRPSGVALAPLPAAPGAPSWRRLHPTPPHPPAPFSGVASFAALAPQPCCMRRAALFRGRQPSRAHRRPVFPPRFTLTCIFPTGCGHRCGRARARTRATAPSPAPARPAMGADGLGRP